MEAFKALDYGFMFDEITKNIDNLALCKNDEKHTKDNVCTECESEYKCINGMFVCVNCGEVGDYEMVPEWIENIWLNRKKSQYIRSRHLRARVEQYVHTKYRGSVVPDFMKVVEIMIKHGMINKNISRCDYCIIRLCSRIDAELIKRPTDVTHSKTRDIFDDRLFGYIYPSLGWDTNCKCPYYSKWEENKINMFIIKKLLSIYIEYRKWKI